MLLRLNGFPRSDESRAVWLCCNAASPMNSVSAAMSSPVESGKHPLALVDLADESTGLAGEASVCGVHRLSA